MIRPFFIFSLLCYCLLSISWSEPPSPDELYNKGVNYQELEQYGLARYYLTQSQWLAPWSSDVHQQLEALPSRQAESISPPLLTPWLPLTIVFFLLGLGNIGLVIGLVKHKPHLRQTVYLTLAFVWGYLGWLTLLHLSSYSIVLLDTPLRIEADNKSAHAKIIKAGTMITIEQKHKGFFLVQDAEGTGYLYPEEVGLLSPFQGTWLEGDKPRSNNPSLEN